MFTAYNYFKSHLLVQEKKSFKGFSIFSSGGHLVQRSGTVLAILIEGHPRNLPVNYFKIDALVKDEKSFKDFSIFSSGGHLVQPSETV